MRLITLRVAEPGRPRARKAGSRGRDLRPERYARLAGHWHTVLPDSILFDLVKRSAEFAHP